MANRAYLYLLKQGVETWNKFMKQFGEEAILDHANLSDADLSGIFLWDANLSYANLDRARLDHARLTDAALYGADLNHADLSYANLNGAGLGDANLSHAILHDTDLGETDLENANLSYADLSYAKISTANLKGANLSGANLSYANIVRSSLDGTNLSGATVGWTQFDSVDLSMVKELEMVKHQGPSTIGTDTIYLSKGNIPEIFLQGAGIPDPLIISIRSLLSQPPDFYSCFISYSSRDEAFTKRLYTDLQSHSVRCWFASEDLKIGDHYHQRIDESIRLYDKLILILSEHAVQSAWVEREVVSAREKEDRLGHEVLFPIRLDDAVMNTTKAWAADVRRRWHIGDFTQWKHHDAYQQAFERLLRDLKAEQMPKD